MTPPTATELPATIWLAPTTAPTETAPDSVVPAWALNRIRTEFTRRPGRTPAPLWRTTIPHMGTSARTSRASGRSVVLAELHPDAIAATALEQHAPGAGGDGLSGFFYRAHRFLRDGGGMLLTASRQRHHDDGELIDPCGPLTAWARSAGFVYRQHILIVHAAANGNHLHPTPDAPTPSPAPFWRHRPLHTDLLLFTTT